MDSQVPRGYVKKCAYVMWELINLVLVGYIDVDMVADLDNRKSTLGFRYTLAKGVVC